MTQLTLSDPQLIAVYDGLMLLASDLYKQSELNLAPALLVSSMLEQIHPSVVSACARLEQASPQPSLNQTATLQSDSTVT